LWKAIVVAEKADNFQIICCNVLLGSAFTHIIAADAARRNGEAENLLGLLSWNY
jgi:hypothetical protein